MIPPKSKLFDPDYQRDQFEKKYHSWTSWVLSASGLIAGADAIREKMTDLLNQDAYDDSPNLMSSMFLLYGFAIECLLKGLYVKKGNKLTSNGKYNAPPNTKSHDLVSLAQVAGFELTPDELDLLCKVSRQIKGVGRYPAGTAVEDEKPLTRSDGSWEHPGTYRSQELLLIDDVLSRIESIVGVTLRL